MIDEDKLIEDIKEWSKEREIKWTSESVISLLESAPKIGEWILYSERLPEEDKDVLIYTSYDGVDMAYISDENWRYTRGDEFINTVENANILAWQPLPPVYIKASKNGNER